MDEFGLNNTEAGLPMSLVALPMIFFSIPAWVLTSRFGFRRAGIMGLISSVSNGNQVS